MIPVSTSSKAYVCMYVRRCVFVRIFRSIHPTLYPSGKSLPCLIMSSCDNVTVYHRGITAVTISTGIKKNVVPCARRQAKERFETHSPSTRIHAILRQAGHAKMQNKTSASNPSPPPCPSSPHPHACVRLRHVQTASICPSGANGSPSCAENYSGNPNYRDKATTTTPL